MIRKQEPDSGISERTGHSTDGMLFFWKKIIKKIL